MLHTGLTAPEFTLHDQNGDVQKLSDYRGRWVLLYFYPKDNTPGCTTEACSFRDRFRDYFERGIQVIGVSPDTVDSHKLFAGQNNLNFPILADENKAVFKMYDALEGNKAKRVSYLISPAGRIEKIYSDVDPSVHAEEILNEFNSVKA